MDFWEFTKLYNRYKPSSTTKKTGTKKTKKPVIIEEETQKEEDKNKSKQKKKKKKPNFKDIQKRITKLKDLKKVALSYQLDYYDYYDLIDLEEDDMLSQAATRLQDLKDVSNEEVNKILETFSDKIKRYVIEKDKDVRLEMRKDLLDESAKHTGAPTNIKKTILFLQGNFTYYFRRNLHKVRKNGSRNDEEEIKNIVDYDNTEHYEEKIEAFKRIFTRDKAFYDTKSSQNMRSNKEILLNMVDDIIDLQTLGGQPKREDIKEIRIRMIHYETADSLKEIRKLSKKDLKKKYPFEFENENLKKLRDKIQKEETLKKESKEEEDEDDLAPLVEEEEEHKGDEPTTAELRKAISDLPEE